MALQPVSGGQYTRISGTGAGTTVINPNAGNFYRVVVGGNFTGTATFYDSATAGGSAAANYIIAMNNNSGTIPMNVEIGARTKNGLIAVVGGTTDMTVIWD